MAVNFTSNMMLDIIIIYKINKRQKTQYA